MAKNAKQSNGSANQKSNQKRNAKQTTSGKSTQKEASAKFSIQDYQYPIFVLIVGKLFHDKNFDGG